MRHTHLNDFLTRYVFHLLLTPLFFSSHFFLTAQLLLESPSNIPYRFSRFEKRLYSFKIFDCFFFTDGVLEYFKVFGPDCAHDEVLIQFLIFGGVCAIHAAAEIDHKYHALHGLLLLFTFVLNCPVFYHILVYLLVAGRPAVKTMISREKDSALKAVEHVDIRRDTMRVFFVEIFYGEFERVGDAALELLQ